MFESHITVDKFEEEDFVAKCKEIGVKPILIKMDSGADFQPQMMTGCFHHTDDVNVAKREMEVIASQFSFIIRKKLELIIGKKTTELPEHLYLEFHSKFEVPRSRIYHFLLETIENGGHASKNDFKLSSDEDKVFCFATARDKKVMKKLITKLSHQYKLINTIMECVVLDSNPQLDIHWHGCNDCAIKTIDLGDKDV